eukprot:TRINITY_DN66319_c0_g1_i1.p1 TRINITY_DN66319_c0_g1~~TRINITY_DN66319_c0_g1_i1.p1  ORF type:complete len:359 (+),score=120.27 TRINITY_DN66319_c0_g1_i1:77-1153(+)
MRRHAARARAALRRRRGGPAAGAAGPSRGRAPLRHAASAASIEAAAVAERLRQDHAFAAQVAAAVDPDTLVRMEEVAAAEDAVRSNPQKVQPPTSRQIRLTCVRSAVPFIGFGIFDNLVMITVGDAIDATFGVTLGFSTMAAAGFGQCCSDACGITLQGFIERFSDRLGLPNPEMTRAQERLNSVKTWQQISRTAGIVLGCLIGMFPLLFLNTHRPRVVDQCFGQLPSEVRSRLQAALSPRLFPEGHKLISRGQEVTEMYLIQNGEVRVIGPDKDGNDMEICTLGPGSVVGDLEIVNGHRAVADVTISQGALTQVLKKEDFYAILGDRTKGAEVVADKLHNDTHYCWYRMQNAPPAAA